MNGSEANFRSDGSCRLTDEIAGTERVWASVSQWAGQWFAEGRANEHGDARDFIGTACDNATLGVVDALVMLAETADGDEELAWVGAGPLVSHSGNGMQMLADVDRAARQNVAFRAALNSRRSWPWASVNWTSTPPGWAKSSTQATTRQRRHGTSHDDTGAQATRVSSRPANVE